uniref:Uncharacterized protein n=1 Tax=Myoviridae sp. ctByu2 TaxID=2827668 RepID=A0A8S5SAL1_9CAUD|nr:MAG TPA: hypothetical protein [Myoviridae sp. ctByu2]
MAWDATDRFVLNQLLCTSQLCRALARVVAISNNKEKGVLFREYSLLPLVP